MSAVNIVRTDRAIHIATDGAGWDIDGKIVAMSTKAFPMQHLNAAIAVRGRYAALPYLAHQLSLGAQAFRDLVERAPHCIAECRADFEMPADEKLEVYLVGYSDEGPEVYYSKSHEGPELRRGSNFITAPGASLADLDQAGFVMWSDDNDQMFCKSMVDLMEFQRADNAGYDVVGCFCQLTTITPGWIAQRILHRWPDAVGGVRPDVDRVIYNGVNGKSELEDGAITFRHYVDDLGMSADDAAKKIVHMQSPEYQASVKAKVKAEDVDAKIRKDLSLGDLAGAFDNSPLGIMPNLDVGFNPAQRSAMFAQYAERVKDRYLKSGDWSSAKKLAASDMGKSWGVSKVNDSATVMPYPPERAPIMSGIDNPERVVADQAIRSVQEQTGYAPKRSSLNFIPVPGLTAQAYKEGRPVPYILAWKDRSGIVQTLSPGQAFVVDAKAARTAASAERERRFRLGSDAAALTEETATPAPLRQYGF